MTWPLLASAIVVFSFVVAPTIVDSSPRFRAVLRFASALLASFACSMLIRAGSSFSLDHTAEATLGDLRHLLTGCMMMLVSIYIAIRVRD
jgi:hypothetical protein